MTAPTPTRQPSSDEARHWRIRTRIEAAKLALWAVFHNAWQAVRTLLD
ncbi:MAG TPA: hypothetical protein VHJ17_14015 [Thermomonospora sp.]|nr:hypothetical protein [Thermomonospora sp.]